MSEMNGKGLPAQIVTVVLKPEETARFQAIPSSSADSSTTPIFSSATQGEMVLWLELNGYEWVSYTNEGFPQQWKKA